MENTLLVNVVLIGEGKLPHYSSKGAAGADLFAALPDGPVTLEVGQRDLIPTGIVIELPQGFEAQIRPRSGLAIKNGITVLNSPGTIDCDYRGEIKIPIINLGDESFTINHHMRIAQMIIAPVVQSRFVEASEVSSTTRGERGFGSTGV